MMPLSSYMQQHLVLLCPACSLQRAAANGIYFSGKQNLMVCCKHKLPERRFLLESMEIGRRG